MKTIFKIKSIFFVFAFFLLFFLGSVVLTAQGNKYVFKKLTIDDGLSHNSVYSIIQDKEGFMWFGSEDGLNRFDGYEFVIFRHDPANPNSLSSSNFGKMIQDEDGIFWFATWGGGLNRYDPVYQKFTHYKNNVLDSTGLSSDKIEFIFEDIDHTLWIGTDGGGLNHFDKRKNRFSYYLNDPGDPQSIGDNHLKAFLKPDSSMKDEIWFGTNSGITILNRHTGKFRHITHDSKNAHSLSDNHIRSMVKDKDGNIWIGTRGGGLNVYNLKTKNCRHYFHERTSSNSLAENAITTLFIDSFGDIWVGTYKEGLNKYDKRNERFLNWEYSPQSPYGLSHDRVEVIYEDRSKNLWIGTRGGGINYIDLKQSNFKWYYFTKGGGGLPNPNVNAIYGDPKNPDKIYLGTDGAGLSVFNRRKFTFMNHSEIQSDGVFAGSRVWSIYKDSQDELWTGLYAEGLVASRLLRGNIHITVFGDRMEKPFRISNSTIQVITEEPDTSIWVGTAEGLNILRYNRSGKPYVASIHKYVKGDSNSISNDYINSIITDSKGFIWIGTRSGLNVVQWKDHFLKRLKLDIPKNFELSSDNINCLHQSKYNPEWIWVGTVENGLDRLRIKYKTKSVEVSDIKSFSELNGLSNNAVRSILEDDNGDLWIGTAKGLSKLDQSNDQIQIFDVDYLFKNQNFTHNACYKTGDGEFFFGSTNGFVTFDPNNIRENPYQPNVVLTQIKIYNKPIRIPASYFLKKQIELDYNQNYLTFSFAGLEYTNPAKNKYAYRLIGVDNDWIYQKERNDIVYSSLDPGDYFLNIKASNNDGVWNQKGLNVKITINSPWWGTPLAKIIYIFLILSATFLAIRLRTWQVTQRNITLKEINTQLEFSEQRFRSIIEHSHESIAIIDEHFMITYVNDKFCELAEIDRNDLVEKDFRDFLDHKSKTQLEHLFIARYQGKEVPATYEIDLTTKKGKSSRVIISASIIADLDGKYYTVAQILDISDRYLNELNLKESEEKYRQVVENASDAIMIELGGKFVFMNKSAQNIFGYSLDEIVQMDSYALIHPLDVKFLKEMDDKWYKGEEITSNFQFRIIDNQKREKWLETNRVRIKINNQPATLIFATDISERKDLERRLQIAHKMEAIGSLAGGIAHDFNNVLSPIIGFSELISEKPDDVNFVNECADYILKAANRASDLISQILAFSHSREQEMVPVSLQAIIKETAKLLRAAMPTSIEIDLNIEEDVQQVFADATQLHQVIMNLGTNAYHAMREKGGKLSIRLMNKVIKESDHDDYPGLKQGNYAMISIDDSGSGIPKTIIDKIFEPFFTTKKKGSGTGMGLAVAHGIIEKHNGKISVYSEEGIGTSFKILLPCVDEKLSEETIRKENKIFTGNGEKILVVDDEIPILTLLKKQLKDLNYSPDVFPDSKEALEAFRTNPKKYDVVITDQNMPGLRGDELSREILKIDKDFPIIMCTGFSDLIDSEKAKAIGLVYFLLKPVMKWELSQVLNSVLSKKSGK